MLIRFIFTAVSIIWQQIVLFEAKYLENEKDLMLKKFRKKENKMK